MTTYTITFTATYDRPLTEDEKDAIVGELMAQFEENDDHPEPCEPLPFPTVVEA